MFSNIKVLSVCTIYYVLTKYGAICIVEVIVEFK